MANTTKRTRQTERHAADAYAERARDLRILLNVIKDRLEEHGRRFTKSGSTDWGYVGDLGHVSESLDNLVEFMTPGENRSE